MENQSLTAEFPTEFALQPCVKAAALWLVQNRERCSGKVLASLRSRFSLTEAEAWTAVILFFGWKPGGAAYGLREE